MRPWKRAREEVFTPEVAASPLVRTPYDLRHAAVSTWLNGGVPPTDVAAWAGHSVEVLLKIYAKCVDGGAELLRKRVQAALGHAPALARTQDRRGQDFGTHLARTAVDGQSSPVTTGHNEGTLDRESAG